MLTFQQYRCSSIRTSHVRFHRRIGNSRRYTPQEFILASIIPATTSATTVEMGTMHDTIDPTHLVKLRPDQNDCIFDSATTTVTRKTRHCKWCVRFLDLLNIHTLVTLQVETEQIERAQ